MWEPLTFFMEKRRRLRSSSVAAGMTSLLAEMNWIGRRRGRGHGRRRW